MRNASLALRRDMLREGCNSSGISSTSWIQRPGWWLIPGGGGRGYLGKFVPLASQSLYPIIVYSATNYRPHLRHFWANMYFLRQSQLSHFLFLWIDPFFKLNEGPFNFHLQIYKHSGGLLTVNLKNCLTPNNPKMCDPILGTPVVKMQPHPAAHAH